MAGDRPIKKWCQKRTRIELCLSLQNSNICDVAFCKGPHKGPQISNNVLVRCLFKDSNLQETADFRDSMAANKTRISAL